MKTLDVTRQVQKLKLLKSIPDNEMIAILDAFLKYIVNDKNIIEVRKDDLDP